MAWALLLVSAVFEAVWATALGESNGLTRPGPTAAFAVFLVLSMAGLGLAAKRIPISVAYAVWTGVGAALTVAWAMATGNEPVSALKVVFLAGIIACVAGLKFTKTEPGPRAAEQGGQAGAGEGVPAAEDRAAR